ncbi:helix-turn-helix transcriptional regulator [Streptomyces hirsutus]
MRMGKTDLALTSLERAIDAVGQSSDPLLLPMIVDSTAWTYERQGRLEDALSIALRTADDMVNAGRDETADGLKVWGALTMSAATSAARSGDYERAATMMEAAEKEAARVSKLPDGGDNGIVSVFSPSSVRIERVRLAAPVRAPAGRLGVGQGNAAEQGHPPSWRTWLLLDVARARTDIGDAAGAVKTLESLRRVAPTWMQHHTLAVAIVRRDLWALPNSPPGLRPLAGAWGSAITWRKWDVAPLSTFLACRLHERTAPRRPCDRPRGWA